MRFQDLYNKLQQSDRQKLSVAVADDITVIEAICKIRDLNIADSILVGNKSKIENIARESKLSLDNIMIINEIDNEHAARKAVELVHFGEANMYMKGVVDTRTFLKSILDKEIGLRTDKLLSHVTIFDIENYNKLLLLTDVAFIAYPTLDEKVSIINNAVQIATTLGIKMPKVAPLCAIEVVNPKMPCTLDAAELTLMNKKGIIKNCIIDGPLSLDLAIVPEAAKHKDSSDRQIVGDADILLMPDIQAGNILYKWLSHFTNHKSGCILAGTSAPVILTSRSDDAETKINSIILATILANSKKTNYDERPQ